MTELSIRPDEIRDALQRFVSDYKPETASREEVGTVAVALTTYQQVAAQVHDERVATVRVAHPLTDSERERLAGALARTYGRDVHLNVVVEPDLIGGLRIEIGDDVIDGTVASRLHDARRRLAG